MKIYFFVYRNWAFQIAKVLKEKYLTNDIEIFTIKRNEIDKSEIIKNNVRIINNKDNKKIYSFLKKKKSGNNFLFRLVRNNRQINL